MAEKGEPWAQVNLAESYEKGKGVAQDYIEAWKWYDLAAAQGLRQATESRNTMMQHMTPEQIAEAKKRIAAFVSRKEANK